MVSQISLDGGPCLGQVNLKNKDGDSGIPSSSQEQTSLQMPVKRQTRQWAAWTRQEEESFFAALRQVGKNFEKITCRVQSKNKDQVRHYYYRLVRRMNKLLGPELSLDAKNSKDTNAAMLRWWSLLEKYSCKASKLHLKPRRYKIFVETLENQLLKDRRKNVKRRLSSGENNTSMPNPSTNPVRALGHDNRAEKMVLMDSQNIEKVETGKGALFKRHVNVGMSRINCKVDPASAKTAKPRRKTAPASTAAYKRWEKAAIAGVSLVADAAEHLERVDTNKENVQEAPGHEGSQLEGRVTHLLQISSQCMFSENISSMKLKLQLFPVDECTRKALEMAHHNPYLELTLSTRKKISSILEHLNHKWGNSNFLADELMLFPYWAQRENLVGCQMWTRDSRLCAADVYCLIGSPPVFRLRYGWFSKTKIESGSAQASPSNASEHNLNSNMLSENTEPENRRGSQINQFVSAESVITPTLSSTSTPTKAVENGGSPSNANSSTCLDNSGFVSLLREEIGELAVARQVENMNNPGLSAGEWADSLTNVSIGDLLSDSIPDMDVDFSDFPVPLGSECPEQIPFSCDSFDAAIAAHIYKHQNEVDSQHGSPSHVPSIWEAEQTCDAFAFQTTQCQSVAMSNSVEGCKLPRMANPRAFDSEIEEFSTEKPTNSNNTSSGHPSEISDKDLGSLSDIYWPDSLGPLDLDISSCRNPSNDLILSDSFSGLSRLVANSLDTFQSCSLFGFDKKEHMSSTSGPSLTASFSDFTPESTFTIS